MNTKRIALVWWTCALCLCAGAQAQSKSSISGPPTELEKLAGHGKVTTGKSARFTLPDSVKLDDGLTADEAVAVALWNNAPFQATLAELGIARAADRKSVV